jgi:hypothetical protein
MKTSLLFGLMLVAAMGVSVLLYTPELGGCDGVEEQPRSSGTARDGAGAGNFELGRVRVCDDGRICVRYGRVLVERMELLQGEQPVCARPLSAYHPGFSG